MATDSSDLILTGPLADQLTVRRLSGTEQLGRLYDYTVELLGSDEGLAFADILGQNLTVRLALDDGGHRYFNGVITRFAQSGRAGRYAVFQAQLRPWLWYLTRCADCRIFQNRSVPEIVEQVFREHGFSDFDDALSGSYASWEYCVQYRESDFNFVSRLLEQEGIYYYFRHEDGKHTLVLSDAASSHDTFPGYEDVPYFPPGNEAGRERDHVSDWYLSQEVQPELFALRDFDFEKPKANLETKESIQREHAAGSFEVYDYPGEYLEKTDGDRLAKIRIEEQQARFERVRGSGNVRGLGAGHLFSLQGYPREDQNREYLLTGVTCELHAGELESAAGGTGSACACTFTAMDGQQQYRPPRVTPKPVVQGPQTATVVGQSGEDVWTDKYGRVKVQFHWDRQGQKDENSSCWVRVSQTAAGKNWGGMFLPHVGQEVIVEFLEGDPDRPIVTGRVYNADNMPPLSLPDHRYCSIIRDHYGNELVMDGTPGEEHIAMYSPSHRSKMLLGRSYKRITDSDEESKVYGNSLSVMVGNKIIGTLGTATSGTIGNSFSLTGGLHEAVQFGASASVFMGAKASISIGPELSLSAATKYSWGYSRSFTYTKGDYRRTSDADIVHDSKGKVLMAGGADDQTIVQSSGKEAFMAYGDAVGRESSDVAAHGFAAASAAAAAASAGAILGTARGSLENLKAAERTDIDPKTGRERSGVFTNAEGVAFGSQFWGGTASAALFQIGSLVALLGHFKAAGDIAVPEHKTEYAKVSVQKDLVDIFAGDKPKSRLRLKPKGIGLLAKGNIELYTGSDGDVFVNKVLTVSKKGGEVKVAKARIKHKNLTVSK